MKKMICMLFLTMFMAIPSFANEFMSQTAVNIVSTSSLQTAVNSSSENTQVTAEAPIPLEKGSLTEKIVVGSYLAFIGLGLIIAFKS